MKRQVKKKSFHECDVCGDKLCSNQSLNHHKISFHDDMQDANEYNCNICEKTFKHKHTLFTHKRTHNTSRSRCDECGRDVKSISLVIHKRMHISKSFSFECSICGEILKTKATLKMHVITLHKRTGQKF